MPVFPQQSLTVRDPGIPLAPAIPTIPVISGVSTGGSVPVNTVVQIGDPATVRSLLGYGPLAEDVALALQRSGGPINAIRHNVTGPALAGAAMVHVGAQIPLITVTGTPNDRYALLVTVVAGGTLGNSTFQYSLDAHDSNFAPFTQSNVRPTVASFAIPNSGLTLTMPAGTYVAGDTFSLACIPGEPGTTDLGTVAGILQGNPALAFALWLISGAQPDDVTGAAFASAFNGYLVGLTNTFRYVRGFCDVGSDDSAANILVGAATWTGSRVCPAYGYTIRGSALPFEGFSNRKTSCVSGLGVRALSELISSDLSRTAAGNDVGVSKIVFDSNYNQAVDQAQISTMRTWPGIPGYYITDGRLKCPFGSNFTDLQYGRVMDAACLVTYKAQFPYISASFRATQTGTVDPRDAKNLEGVVQGSLNAAIMAPLNASGTPGHASSVTYHVDLTTNIVTTQQLTTTVAIVPLGYAKSISTTLAFTIST